MLSKEEKIRLTGSLATDITKGVMDTSRELLNKFGEDGPDVVANGILNAANYFMVQKITAFKCSKLDIGSEGIAIVQAEMIQRMAAKVQPALQEAYNELKEEVIAEVEAELNG